MILRRQMAVDLIEAARYFSVIAILGPRQAGKTTLAKTVFKNHNYVNFEDMNLRLFAETDPKGFLKEYRNEHGIIIDEFQNAPSFLSYIQLDVDEKRKPGCFILTGSQNFLMNQSITQTLAGRISIHTLLPLSISELSETALLPSEVEMLMYQGSYPAIYAQQIPPDRWYPSYIKTYLERDVRNIKQIENLSLFQKFIQLCAGRIGQVVNFTSLANDCGISDMTVRRWLSILEASYIVFLLQPHYKNFNKRLIKSPKIYFYDSGLVCSLLNIKFEELATHYLRGGLFETLVISDFYKHYYNRGKVPYVYYWRDQTGHEVDCVLDVGQRSVPIEIKSSRTITTSFFNGTTYWHSLAKTNPSDSFIIYAGLEDQKRSVGTVLSWKHTATIFKERR